MAGRGEDSPANRSRFSPGTSQGSDARRGQSDGSGKNRPQDKIEYAGSAGRKRSMTSMTIDKRYCGPPNSANGGYVCGRLAQNIPGGAELPLRAPPPLDKPLDVV